MFGYHVSLMIILALHHQVSQTVAETPNIQQRIEGLKQEIMEEIHESQAKANQQVLRAQTETPTDTDYNYDLVVTEVNRDLITPINVHPHYPRNKRGKSKVKKNKPKKTTTTERPTTSSTNAMRARRPRARNTTHRHRSRFTPRGFYKHRRLYLDESERNKPQKWTHCLELITPRLNGLKSNWQPKQINNTSNDVRRLSYLLSMDVSEYTKDEIISVLYQISNIPIRIFQWDYTAITSVLNVIINGPSHNFKTLKAGIKELFVKWQLDTSMMATFLEQTRIFRPPCVDTSEYEGSTKTTGGVRYSKPYDKPKNTNYKKDSDNCDD